MSTTPEGSNQGLSGGTWVILACLAGLVLWFMTQCTSPSDSDSASTGASQTLTNEERFVNSAREVAPQLTDSSDATLLDAGRTVCAELDAGTPFSDVVTVSLVGMGASSDEQQQVAGAVVGAAVSKLCPEHTEKKHTFSNR